MKFRLLTPGPTPAPEETLLELAKPMIFHRLLEFRQILGEVIAELKKVFCTQDTICPLTCSGSGAMEAALVNVVPQGKKAIILSAGKFGDRWKSIAQAFGIEPVYVKVPWGEAVTPEQLEKALADHPDAVAVCSTLSETSTGVGHDIEAFGKLVARRPAVLLVDAISGLGAMEFRQDAWKVDVCVTGSQKALMMPPGLGYVSVSDKAWKVIDANTQARTFYLDLKKARKSLETNDTPYTPAHTLFRAQRVSLKLLLKDGIEGLWARQAKLAKATRAGIEAMGLEIFAKPPNTALTVFRMPAGIDSSEVLSKLEKQFGLKLANGQDAYKGKIIRLAHMGYLDQFDILAGLSGLEIVLSQMGHRVEIGSGLTAAQKVLAES